jgi:hypothetical protein
VPRRLGGRISTKEILHFGKSGLWFLDILFSNFLLRKDSSTCGTDSPYDRRQQFVQFVRLMSTGRIVCTTGVNRLYNR